MPPACTCTSVDHVPRLIVLTGGPGAGKTATLEVVQRELCGHVTVVPEAASILWKGGFPRRSTELARRAAQRAIARVQGELQRLAVDEGSVALVVCDRGVLDGLAYWPGEPDEFFAELGTTRAAELARYDLVIHLRPPQADHGYQGDAVRVEDATEAARLDAAIERAWAGHPRHVVIASDDDFLHKLRVAVDLIRAEVPACCQARAGRGATA